jgi:hypothetical protein
MSEHELVSVRPAAALPELFQLHLPPAEVAHGAGVLARRDKPVRRLPDAGHS